MTRSLIYGFPFNEQNSDRDHCLTMLLFRYREGMTVAFSANYVIMDCKLHYYWAEAAICKIEHSCE